MPQIIMINHAAWVTAERNKTEDKEVSDEPKFRGKSLGQMNTDEMKNYYRDL